MQFQFHVREVSFLPPGGGSWNWIEIHKNELFSPPLTNVSKISAPPFTKEENFMPYPSSPLRLHFTALISVQPNLVKMKQWRF